MAILARDLCSRIRVCRGKGWMVSHLSFNDQRTTMLKSALRCAGNAYYRNLWGQGDERARGFSAYLQSSFKIGEMYQHFVPAESSRFILKPGSVEAAYETWPAIDELFIHLYPGVQTSRDLDLGFDGS